jgi:hypothetical protein
MTTLEQLIFPYKHGAIDSDAPIESISVMVTPHLASVWRKKWHYIGQRDFRQWHCDNLVRMIKAGIFRKKTQIAFVEVGGVFYLTNGQHTLAAIELANTTQELSVIITRGGSMDDVADDFSRHDTHLTRKFADSLVAHSVHEELGTTITVLQAVSTASAYYAFLHGEVQSKTTLLTHDAKLAIVRKYGRLGVGAYNYFDGATNKSFLTRKTTLASAMLCKHYRGDAANSFWPDIALDDGLRLGDPRKTLLEWLRQRVTPGGAYATVRASMKTAPDHELMKGIAAAWNAWVSGRDLKQIKINFEAKTATFESVGEFIVRSAPRQRPDSVAD